MGKKFYFVRSKIDNNLSDAKRCQREYDEEKTLQEIRENCIQGLKKQNVESPQVFLVSSFDLHLYDFPALQDTMERELPSHKKDVLNWGISKVCKSIINKKKEHLGYPPYKREKDKSSPGTKGFQDELHHCSFINFNRRPRLTDCRGIKHDGKQ
ncbi:unnamed protein product [Gadus morhua 'NCC']